MNARLSMIIQCPVGSETPAAFLAGVSLRWLRFLCLRVYVCLAQMPLQPARTSEIPSAFGTMVIQNFGHLAKVSSVPAQCSFRREPAGTLIALEAIAPCVNGGSKMFRVIYRNAEPTPTEIAKRHNNRMVIEKKYRKRKIAPLVKKLRR